MGRKCTEAVLKAHKAVRSMRPTPVTEKLHAEVSKRMKTKESTATRTIPCPDGTSAPGEQQRLSKVEWKKFVDDDAAFDQARNVWFSEGAYQDIKRMQIGLQPLTKNFEDLAIIKKSMPILEEGYQKAPMFSGDVYRGMKLDEQSAKQWTTPGNEIEFDSWNAFSRSEKTANRFGNYIFKMQTSKGMELFGTAKEVLLPKGNRVRVKSVVGNVVELEEL